MAGLTSSWGWFGGGGGIGGWSGNRLEQVQHFKGWPYIAIKAICEEIAGMHPTVARVLQSDQAAKSKSLLPRRYRMKALASVQEHEELEPVKHNHPLLRLLRNPNGPDVESTFFYKLVLFGELTGISYVWKVRNGLGLPCELWVLPSHWVRPFPDPKKEKLIGHYEVRPFGLGVSASSFEIAPDDMITLAYPNPLNPIDGYSPFAAIAQWQDTAEAVDYARFYQFKNGSYPTLAAKIDKEIHDPDQAQLEKFGEEAQAKYAGVKNTGKILIPPPGVEVTPISSTPEEMAYVPGADQLKTWLLAAYRVGSSIVGLAENTNYACLDEETECLTASGWVRFDALSKDTRVACYDPDAKTIIYRRPSNVVVYDYDGEMVLMQNGAWKRDEPSATIMVTPNHRVWHTPEPEKENWRFKQAEDITARMAVLCGARAACDTPTEIKLPKKGLHNLTIDEDPRHIDPAVWCDFIGWYVSEGCIHLSTRREHLVTLTQKAVTEKEKEIDAILERMPVHFRKAPTGSDGSGCVQWRATDKGLFYHLERNCGLDSHTKKIPEYMKSWPAEYLERILMAAIQGDGSEWTTGGKRGDGACVYLTTSKQLADDIQEIACKCGFRAWVSKSRPDPRPDRVQVWRVNISKRARRWFSPKDYSRVPYKGKVWCVEVPTGLFVVRRKGWAHITGNSMVASRANFILSTIKPKLVFYGQVFTEKLAKEFDEDLVVYWPDVTPDDPAQKLAENVAYLAAGVKAVNEVRSEIGMEPYPHGGDDPMLPMGAAPVPWVTGEQDLGGWELPPGPLAAETNEDGETANGEANGQANGNGRLSTEVNGHAGPSLSTAPDFGRRMALGELSKANGVKP